MTRGLSKPFESKTDAALEPHDYIAFHATLQQTHDDDVLDQAAAALPSLIIQRQDPEKSHYYSLYLNIQESELSSIFSMLSAEASIRSNLTAANLISEHSKGSNQSKSLLSITVCCNKVL